MSDTTTMQPPPARRPAPPPVRAPGGQAVSPPPGDGHPVRRRQVTLAAVKPVAAKLVIYAVEGFAKTTIGAHTPSPLILMARGETGYTTLLSNGRVPHVPSANVETWEDLLGWVDDLTADQQGVQTLVLDAMSGFERLCHEYICAKNFNNDWSEKGFTSFQKGYEVSVSEWIRLLAKLEQLNQRGVSILILSHAKVAPFKNPIGPDYDRFSSDVHPKTWAPTSKWADAVLFGNFFTVVDKESKNARAKGVGGADRVLYTERRDAWDAKNRYGMPPEVWFPNVGPEGMWETIWRAIVNKP